VLAVEPVPRSWIDDPGAGVRGKQLVRWGFAKPCTGVKARAIEHAISNESDAKRDMTRLLFELARQLIKWLDQSLAKLLRTIDKK